MDSSGSPGTATFGNDSSSGSTGMLAVPAIADSPDTQQSASSGTSHDLAHLSWKEVGHAVWSKDGEKKRSSSASLSTPKRSVKGVMSPVRKEKRRSKSPTGSSPSKISQENKTLKQEVEEAKLHLAMLQESYERDDQGNVTRVQELERRAGMSEQQVAHILKRSDEQLREAAQCIDIQRGKTKLSEDQAQHLVKICGEYQDEARLKVLEYEKLHQEMAATVCLNIESDARRKAHWLARTRLNKRGEAFLPKSHSINR